MAKRILKINDQKKAIKYANIFIERIPKEASRILVYGIAEVRVLNKILDAFPDKEFTIVEQINIVNLLKKIYTSDRYTFVEAEYDSADLALFKEEGEIGRMPRFDCAIMNPPYDKNLHLKILSKIVGQSDLVVNISPIRWLQDPVAKFKKHSDQKTYGNIVKRMNDLYVLSAGQATELFGNVKFSCSVGIYTIHDGGWENPYASNPIVDKIVSFVKNSGDSLRNHIKDDTMSSGYCCLIKRVGLNSCYRDSSGSGTMSFFVGKDEVPCDQRNVSFYKNGRNEKTGETYLEYRNRTCWGNILPKDHNTNIKFDTAEERENFFSTYSTRTMGIIIGLICIGTDLQSDFLPWLDFSHPWTDKDLCEHFGITGYISDTEAEPGSEWETILKKTL